ncbi:M16 family metallopeptidase [Nannocystis sp. SCPEA4]|uniref:M16 family metallopeptidase n=1 Tax=Nannocystis sp. SCPEA4 TaxID=2996787 RepID=UPI00226FC028|nr:M16 family metallopeptidase [Nannocystis sp. SCPEA4]MCY1053842.1 insulinase family protein [Nannocystis sp. SCPEA4]
MLDQTSPAPVPDIDPERAAILAASALPELLPVALPDDPLGVTIHRLSNGLTVYISPDAAAPRVTAWIAFRAGSRHDPPHSTGLAHYLEHMMFKGTARLGTLDGGAEAPHVAAVAELYDRLGAAVDPAARATILADIDRATQACAALAIPNEVDRLYAQLGITDVNAFTSDDMTVYSADVPAARLATWAEIEADRLQQPVFRLFYPELEAVYEEKNMALDAPDDRLDEAMRLALFPGHPYGTQPTIGSTEHLKTPAYGEMVAYHRRNYLPNNAAILLAGDVDPATALPALERAFAGWRPAPLSAPAPGDLAGPRGRVVHELLADGEQSVTLAFRTVPIGHPDEPALRLLERVLGDEVGGLVAARLLLPQRLPDAEVYGALMNEGGYLAFTGVARDGQSLADVERLLREVITAARDGAIAQDDLDAAVLHETLDAQGDLENGERRVEQMLEAYTGGRPWPVHVRRLDALRALTPADLARVARTYLGDDVVVVSRRRGRFAPPEIEKPQITPVAIDPTRQSAYAREVLARPVDDPPAEQLLPDRDYVRKDMSCGPLIAARNSRSELFTLILRYDLGTRRRPLLGHAAGLLARSGVRDGEQLLDAPALQRRLYALGTEIDVDVDADRTEIVVNGIDRNMEASLALLDAWLAGPVFTDAVLADLVANTLSGRRDEEDDPDDLAAALRDWAAFGDASPFLTRPSDKQLRRAKGPELVAELRALRDAAHVSLYFGPRPADVAAAALVLGQGRPVDPPPPLRYRSVAAPTIFFLHKDVAQARIDIVLPRPPQPVGERPRAELLGHVLGGDMSGMAFQEIREARGLAYHAGAHLDLGDRLGDDAALVGSLGTQCDKAGGALALMLDLLRTSELAPDRVAAARLALLREYASERISPRSRPGWVQSWADLGHLADPRLAAAQTIRTVEPAALQAYLAEFAGTAPIVSVLGDRKRVDLDRLRALGEVHVVTPSTLFSHAR